MTILATNIAYLLEGIFGLPCTELVFLGVEVVPLLVQP